MKMVYQWKEGTGGRKGCDAQVAGEYIESLRHSSANFTTQVMVDDATSNLACPYRNYFDWDDARAANHYRCSQAHDILRSIQVVVNHDNTEQVSAPIRAFVSLGKQTVDENGINEKQTIESIVEVMSDEDKRRMLMSKALGELNSWRLRYQALAEFAKLFTFIDALTAKLGDKIGYVQHTDRAEDGELQEVRGDD